jgi:hypothetical protein
MYARRTLAALVLAGAALSASQAHAQARDPVAAEARFRAGRAAAEKGDYEAACSRFRESQSLDPAPGTTFNLADCEEHRGKLATAWELFTRVASALPPGDDRVKIASGRAAALEKRLPKLTITLAQGAPGGTAVRRDGVDIGPATLGVPLPIDPGQHVIVVRAPGRDDHTTTVDIGEGEQKTIEALPTSASAPAAVEGVSPRRTAGYVVIGVGAASLVVFAATGIAVLVEKGTFDQHCMSGLCDMTGFSAGQSGQKLGTASGASLAAGLVAVAAGTVLVLTSGPGKKPTTALLPSAGPSGASLSLLHRW